MLKKLLLSGDFCKRKSVTTIWIFVTTFYRKMLFRPMSAPDPSVTLGVRSVGHYCVSPGQKEPKMIKNFVQLFWSVKGEGTIHLKGRPHVLKAGMIAFYFPGDIHDIEFVTTGKPWEYRWFTLDGDLSLTIVRGFKFNNSEPYYAGPPPVALFEKLTTSLRDVTLSGELQAGALAFDLLSKAAERAKPGMENSKRGPRRPPPRRLTALSIFRQKATEVVQRHWADPIYGVEQMAAELGLHRSSFSRKFHAAFDLSPSSYLLRWRVQNALNLLRNSDLPIAEVARSCGWEDANYFARCIGKATGMKPSEFRRIGSFDLPPQKKQ